MPTHRITASATNLLDEENEKAPLPIEAEALPSNTVDNVCRASSPGLSRPFMHGASASWIKIGMSAPREAIRIVLALDACRVVRMGCVVRLVRGPLDANALVARIDRLIGPGVHLGVVEEHDRLVLDLAISDEIINLELEIALQIYRERLDLLDKRLHELRQSQELLWARC
ncbi:hypothetical protein D1007_06519 [Hordeum vulgare]|nr:hypothetical protein D1007_06519 [Hordeum vulgare]